MSFGKVIYELINKNNGFYIDIGAYDGLDSGEAPNQTKFLEDIGWSGICIEAHPIVFMKLKQNRKCICHNAIIYKDESEYDMCWISPDRCGNGIKENMPPTHYEKHLLQYGLIINKMKTIHLESILDMYDIPEQIDFLKIDTEGSDFIIVQSLSFTKYIYDYILIENAWTDMNIIKEWFKEHNYKFLEKESISTDSLFRRIK